MKRTQCSLSLLQERHRAALARLRADDRPICLHRPPHSQRRAYAELHIAPAQRPSSPGRRPVKIASLIAHAHRLRDRLTRQELRNLRGQVARSSARAWPLTVRIIPSGLVHQPAIATSSSASLTSLRACCCVCRLMGAPPSSRS